MEVVGTPEELQCSESLLSLWLLSSLVPELGRELQDVALGPARQQREDVTQVGPGLDGHVVTLLGRNILKDAMASDVFVATPELPTSRLVAPTLAELNDDPQFKRAVLWADGTTSPAAL